MLGAIGLLVAGAFALGPISMLKLYVVPYWIGVMWLDAVTYLHHHGPDEKTAPVPWYRGEVFPLSPPPTSCLLLRTNPAFGARQ